MRRNKVGGFGPLLLLFMLLFCYKHSGIIITVSRGETMKEYHKIQTVFKRDPETKHKTLLLGDFSIEAFEYLATNTWMFTEKVDGTNIRVMFQNGELSFGGKTDTAQIPATLVNALNGMFNADQLASVFDEDGACLYGEGYGARIQKGGGNYRQDQSFVLFDVKIGDWWLRRADVEDVAKKLGLDVVPIIGEGNLYTMVRMAQEGFASQWGDFLAEGIVARPTTELFDRGGRRIITKIKHRDFIQP